MSLSLFREPFFFGFKGKPKGQAHVRFLRSLPFWTSNWRISFVFEVLISLNEYVFPCQSGKIQKESPVHSDLVHAPGFSDPSRKPGFAEARVSSLVSSAEGAQRFHLST